MLICFCFFLAAYQYLLGKACRRTLTDCGKFPDGEGSIGFSNSCFRTFSWSWRVLNSDSARKNNKHKLMFNKKNYIQRWNLSLFTFCNANYQPTQHYRVLLADLHETLPVRHSLYPPRHFQLVVCTVWRSEAKFSANVAMSYDTPQLFRINPVIKLGRPAV